MAEQNKSEETSKTKNKFGVISLIWLVLLMLYTLAIISHDVNDLAILEGGVDKSLPEANWIGNVGANIARAMLYLFGLAVYPMGFLLIVSVIRKFLPYPLKRQGYVSSFISVFVGIILLMAMWPANFQMICENLGIGRVMHPDMCLSGGTIGAAFAAPPVFDAGIQLEAGLLRRHIGETGTLVVALAFLLPGLFFLFMQDWYPPIMANLKRKTDPDAGETTVVTTEEQSDNTPAAKDEPEEPEETSTVTPPPPPPAPAGKRLGFADRLKVLVTGRQPDTADAAEETAEAPAETVIAPPPAAVIPQKETASSTVANATPEQEEEDTPAVVAPPPQYKVSGLPPTAVQPEKRKIVLEDDDDADTPAPVAPPPQVKQFSDEKSAFDREKPSGNGNGNSKLSFDSSLDYKLPPVALLDKQEESHTEDAAHIEKSRERLQKTLESFNVDGHVSEIIVGPRVTRFEITLAAGVKVEKITGIQNNIAMDLAAESIRILAPIPGKTTVGIEVPNKVSSVVYIRSLFESAAWRESNAQLPIILGRDIAGKVIVTDLAKAPHLLIAGSTGSGKSVCMNTLIMSLLFKYSPAELRLIMVDPKVVELEMYRLIPHLITPVVNDPKKVPLALRWGVNEMERRYRVLAKVKAKNLEGFNNRPQDQVPVYDEDGERIPQKLPLVIIIIDELADIMMTEAKSDVETSICRIAQKGRAAGIHLVIATQTPRKDIITGLIKANLPTKIAFRVGSNMDSRVILDAGGAEKLLGKGDMLFNPPGGAGLIRIQGSMVSDPEIQKVADFVSVQVEQNFDAQVLAEDVQVHNGGNDDGPVSTGRSSREDQFGPDVDDIIGELPGDEFINSCAAKYLKPGDSDLLRKALEIIIMEQKASTSYLQRRLGIGYNKSAELMDQLEERGIISAPLPGGQKRNILITDGLEENHPES